MSSLSVAMNGVLEGAGHVWLGSVWRPACTVGAVLSLSIPAMMLNGCSFPGTWQVYKDECMFCFACPQTPGGLYINLKTHQVRVVLLFGCLQAGIWALSMPQKSRLGYKLPQS